MTTKTRSKAKTKAKTKAPARASRAKAEPQSGPMHYRQGDVLLVAAAELPKDVEKLDHANVAQGTATGNSHRFESGAEQWALVGKVREDWLKIGLSTEPANFFRAFAGIDHAYRTVGAEPPKLRLAVMSPFAGMLAVNYLIELGKKMKTAKPDEHSQLSSQLYSQLYSQLSSQLYSQLYSQLSSQLRENWSHLRGLRWYGNLSWGLGWYEFFELAKLFDTSKQAGLREVARNAGWWWVLKGATVVSDRPCVLVRDDRNRLHSATGPAIAYRDGWAIWAWHGVRVPKRVIMESDKIPSSEVVAETNAQIRSVMIERVGMTRLMKELDGKVVQKDRRGRLLKLEVRGLETIVTAHVKCPSTGSEYFLRVPPNLTTVRQALAWTFNMGPDEYGPRVES